MGNDRFGDSQVSRGLRRQVQPRRLFDDKQKETEMENSGDLTLELDVAVDNIVLVQVAHGTYQLGKHALDHIGL
jgi:hypothetical protein